MQIDLQAHAKINLFLNVIGKRPDGYHEIETVFQSIELHDRIWIRKKSSGIKIICEHSDVPVDERNIAFKAASMLIESSNINQGVEILIDKKIPVGAGLGGGSTDAAATLVGMNRLFELGYSETELMQFGTRLGADVPFCIIGGTAIGRGIGEDLIPLPPLKNLWIVLVNPGFEISTAWAYKNLNLMLTKSEKNVSILNKAIKGFAPNKSSLLAISEQFFNIFESVVEVQYPTLAELKEMLQSNGTLAVTMTGSGPTFYALMEDKTSAVRLVNRLSDKISFCILTKTCSSGIKIRNTNSKVN